MIRHAAQILTPINLLDASHFLPALREEKGAPEIWLGA